MKNSKLSETKRNGKKNSSRKTKLKKGKVQIPASRIILFSVAVIAISLLLLIISIKSANNEKKPASKETVHVEKPSDKERTYPGSRIAEQVEIKPPVESKNEIEETKQPDLRQPDLRQIEKKSETAQIEKNQPETKPTEKNPTGKKSSENVSEKTPEKKQPSETSQKKTFDFPAAVNNAQLVFVFDDGGQNLGQLERFLKLPFQFTVAVLPGLSHSVQSAKAVRESGKELILHQPMQSINPKVNPGPGAITPDMDEDEIISVLFRNITEIGPIEGLNNHEGSAITADAEKMAVVLKVASEEGIYFLDSRTNVETKVPYVASEMGYSYYERNVFLDNEKTRESILGEINRGIKIANKNGAAIMIGHVWSADILPAILEEIYPELTAKGYVFVAVSKCSAKK